MELQIKNNFVFLYELKPVTGLNLIATGVFFWRQLPFGEHFLCAGACAVGEGRHCCPQGHMAKGKGRAPDHKVPPLWGPLVSHLCSPKHGVTVDSVLPFPRRCNKHLTRDVVVMIE